MFETCEHGVRVGLKCAKCEPTTDERIKAIEGAEYDPDALWLCAELRRAREALGELRDRASMGTILDPDVARIARRGLGEP